MVFGIKYEREAHANPGTTFGVQTIRAGLFMEEFTTMLGEYLSTQLKLLSTAERRAYFSRKGAGKAALSVYNSGHVMFWGLFLPAVNLYYMDQTFVHPDDTSINVSGVGFDFVPTGSLYVMFNSDYLNLWFSASAYAKWAWESVWEPVEEGEEQGPTYRNKRQGWGMSFMGNLNF